MTCMAKKACRKEEGTVVLLTLVLASCQLMTCLSSSLEMISTFLDQQDLTIRSSVRSDALAGLHTTH